MSDLQQGLGYSKINNLIQQLAWYYRVNDCKFRRDDDALEVPISDLRAAYEIARELGLPYGPAHTKGNV